MRQIVLADQYETQNVVNQEKETWVRNMLILLGVPNAEIYDGNDSILAHYDLQVWNDIEYGDIEIIQNNVLVAKWYAPKLVAKCDENNKIYYEIHIDYDSVFDNEFNFASDDGDDK